MCVWIMIHSFLNENMVRNLHKEYAPLFPKKMEKKIAKPVVYL